MQSTSSHTPDERGFKEITVIVNRSGAHRRKRFVGQLLVRWLQPARAEDSTEILCVYLTAGNQYALHTRVVPEWDFSNGDPDHWGNPQNWGVRKGWLRDLMGWGYDWETFKESGDYSLEVFKTLDELKAHVSSDLYQAVTKAETGPDIEDLDI